MSPASSASPATPSPAVAGSAPSSPPPRTPGLSSSSTGASAPSTAATDPGKPSSLAAPRDGGADDLKLIKGIGPKNEAACNALGVHHFDQIAAWSPENATWVGHHLAFPGRIEREHWIDQAKLLSIGVDTPHAEGVRSGAIVVDTSADAPLNEADIASLREAMPALSPKVEDEHLHAGTRPVGLAAPRGGTPDDLQLIKGIGKQNETRLRALGIWHFTQISAWTPDQVHWVGSYLAFPGRITREAWISQAAGLAAGKPALAPKLRRR